MPIPTVPLNEAYPAGAHYIRDGDDRIREYKIQNRQILEIDHIYPSSGQDDDCGKHKQLTLIEQADIGSGSEGYAALGAQTVDGKPELVYTDEDDNDVQITKDGAINLSAEDLKASLLNIFMPVGFIYISTVSTNPGTYLGGTWTAFGTGRVLVGYNAADGDFNEVEKTGGAKTHTLTTDQMPAHTHTVPITRSGNYSSGGTSSGTTSAATTTSSTGGGSAHNNLQPYIVVYMWKRTA